MQSVETKNKLVAKEKRISNPNINRISIICIDSNAH